MNKNQDAQCGIFLALMLVFQAAFAEAAANKGDLSTPGFLEEPKIVAAGKDGEIHINFSSEVRYIRHFPERRGGTLRIFVEMADPCVIDEIKMQESRWLPRTDWYVPFVVTFPELIKRSSSGTAICQATKKHVNVAETLLIKFDKDTTFKVRPGSDNRSIVVIVPLLKEPPETRILAKTPEPVPAPAPMPPVPQPEQPPLSPAVPETMAPAELLAVGKAALAAGDGIKATEYFNRLLLLPSKQYSQEAQELVGMAREQAGEIDKAKAEYQLYLKLYPESEGAARVTKRLVALDTAKPPVAATAEGKAKPRRAVRQVHQDTVTGSISQYYYGGKTQESTDVAGSSSDRKSTDQSAIITNLDATGRFRRNQYDTRIVFRDTQTHNFLPGRPDKNTVSAAYFEHENKDVNYMIRLGRQSGTSQGVLGRFDGGFLRYGLNERWRIAAVAGEPDDGSHNQIVTKRHFYGAAIEFGPLNDKWSGDVYVIQQVADGLTERRALGSELRYFNGTTSWFGLLDYDTLYEAVNIAMLQGNWSTDTGYNFNMLLDHRKSPILYGELAIPTIASAGARSVGDLRARFSDSTIYSYVKGVTPDSDMAMIGVTKQVTDRWQLGGDVRVNRTTTTDGAGEVVSQPGSGNIYAYTVQAIGTNTLFKDDTSVIMASYINDPHYNAQNLSFSNTVALHERWRVDSSLRYYHETRNTDATTWKVTPTIRLGYRWRDNMSFEVELSVDRSSVDDPSTFTKTDTWRETLFAGYRWDFR